MYGDCAEIGPKWYNSDTENKEHIEQPADAYSKIPPSRVKGNSPKQRHLCIRDIKTAIQLDGQF